MKKAPRLLPASDLESVRERVLTNGGIIFRRMCPRQYCHSVVVRHETCVVCLTCGWSQPVTQWGSGHRFVTAEQAQTGRQADFRRLALHADPQRWSRLFRRAHKRGDLHSALHFQEHARSLALNQLPQRTVRQWQATDGRRLHPFHPPQLQDNAPEAVIYTDGSCDPNPGPGGWAAIIWTADRELELGGHARRTNSNRMEMRAALEGLRSLSDPMRVTVVTDSAYLAKGMTAWITGWSKHDWRRDGRKIPNADLWQSLVRAARGHETRWTWTKGHAGHTEHERCDRLARRMATAPEDNEAPSPHQRELARYGRLPNLRCRPTATVWLPEEVE